MNPDDIRAALKRLQLTHEEIAEAIGRDRTAVTRMLGGKRSIKVDELPVLEKLIRENEHQRGELEPPATQEYLPVEILPTYAGMGGGGNGEGDQEYGLVPRRLIEDELRGKAEHFLLIDTRGDSMEPDFSQGDQILIDKRDTNPTQPGPFAIWDGDGHVIKNIEKVRDGWRVFSSNSKYSERIHSPDEIQVIGRPVWFGRRL